MQNIIKSQFYQLRKEKIPFITFFGLIAALLSIVIMNYNTLSKYGDSMTGGEYFADMLSPHSIMPLLFVAITVCLMCGGDFMDKTTSYELMSGHLRRHVYLGRAIPCLIVGTLGWLIISVIPVIAMTAIYGWGEKIPAEEAILRYLLMLFPVMRIICEFIFFTFLIKNPYIVMAGGYMFIMILEINVSGISSGALFLGTTNLSKLTLIDTWATYGLQDEMNFVYDAHLPISDIVGTIAVSLSIGAAALYLGYQFFKNDDMN